jgi:hypothetical protein
MLNYDFEIPWQLSACKQEDVSGQVDYFQPTCHRDVSKFAGKQLVD